MRLQKKIPVEGHEMIPKRFNIQCVVGHVNVKLNVKLKGTISLFSCLSNVESVSYFSPLCELPSKYGQKNISLLLFNFCF